MCVLEMFIILKYIYFLYLILFFNIIDISLNFILWGNMYEIKIFFINFF